MGIIRLALFLALILLAMTPSLLIAALLLKLRKQPITQDALIATGRSQPLLILLNFACFGGLIWLLFQIDG